MSEHWSYKFHAHTLLTLVVGALSIWYFFQTVPAKPQVEDRVVRYPFAIQRYISGWKPAHIKFGSQRIKPVGVKNFVDEYTELSAHVPWPIIIHLTITEGESVTCTREKTITSEFTFVGPDGVFRVYWEDAALPTLARYEAFVRCGSSMNGFFFEITEDPYKYWIDIAGLVIVYTVGAFVAWLVLSLFLIWIPQIRYESKMSQRGQ